MPLRLSLLLRSHQSRDAALGGLFFPLGLHLISCLWGRWAGILHTCPNYQSLLCRSWSTIGNSPRFSRMVVFHILPHKMTPRMSWRLPFGTSSISFLRSLFDTLHVLAPYSETGITRVPKACSLVSLLRLWLLNT